MLLGERGTVASSRLVYYLYRGRIWDQVEHVLNLPGFHVLLKPRRHCSGSRSQVAPALIPLCDSYTQIGFLELAPQHSPALPASLPHVWGLC